MVLISLCDGRSRWGSLRRWKDQRLGIDGSILDWWRVVDGFIITIIVHQHRPKKAKAAPKARPDGGNHLPSNHVVVNCGETCERIN